MFHELSTKGTGKHSKPVVEIPVLVANLTGEDQETVDFRNKMLALIYQHLQRTGQEKRLMKLFEELDETSDGSLDPHDFKKALRKVNLDTPNIDLEQFIRFLEKTKKRRIDYLKFMNMVKLKGNKNYNPFKTVVQRLAVFM